MSNCPTENIEKEETDADAESNTNAHLSGPFKKKTSKQFVFDLILWKIYCRTVYARYQRCRYPKLKMNRVQLKLHWKFINIDDTHK